jgi:hypothetical protein
MSRAISEGLGVVTGASGKVVDIAKPAPLVKYRGLKIESITVTSGLKTPPGLTGLIRENMEKVAARKKLAQDGQPRLLVSGEVINYETADTVDTAIGPIEECIVRAQLMDAESGEVLSVVNLVSRAKSTTAGGAKNLSEGIGKALSKWLKAGGITTEEEREEAKKAKD